MALITLSPGQFAKRRPKGNYQSYLRYLDARRAGKPVGTPVGKQVSLPMDPSYANKLLLQNLMSGYLNPKQMRQQAVLAVNDSIKSALGDLRSTTAAAQKQATDQARAMEGFGRYLAQQRISDAAADQALYGGAAEAQSRFADSLTGNIGAAAQASADANVRDAVAATGTGGGYHGPNPQALASVGEYLGGFLPASNLAENAAYAGQHDRAQGIALAARLGLEGAGARQKTLDLQAELARERAKLVAGRPGAIREQLKGLADDQRSNLATLANVLYLQNTQAKTTADLTGTYQGQPTIDTYRDAQGTLRRVPSGYRVKTSKNGTQFLAPLPAPPSKSRSSVPRNKAGLTPSEQNTQTRRREEAIQDKRGDMLTALQDQKGPLWTQPDEFHQGLPGYGAKRKSYAQAKQYLLTNYANDLIRQYPAMKARILQTVEEALSSAGFRKATAQKPTAPVLGGGLFGALNPMFPVPGR